IPVVIVIIISSSEEISIGIKNELFISRKFDLNVSVVFPLGFFNSGSGEVRTHKVANAGGKVSCCNVLISEVIITIVVDTKEVPLLIKYQFHPVTELYLII